MMKNIRMDILFILQTVNKKPASQLRLKPGGLRRHQKSCVRHRKQLPDGCGIQGKGCGAVLLTPSFQFLQPPDSSYKINSFIRSGICDSKDRFQNHSLQNGHVQFPNRIGLSKRISCRSRFPVLFSDLRLPDQTVPFLLQIQTEPPLSFRPVRPFFRSDFKDLFDFS